jgi:hypothetical protein
VVTTWGELPGEQKLPGVLRVLIGGQHAGAIEYDGNAWTAQAHGPRTSRPSAHATAGEAVAAIVRSSCGRRLGARPASTVRWSAKAGRLAAKAG